MHDTFESSNTGKQCKLTFHLTVIAEMLFTC